MSSGNAAGLIDALVVRIVWLLFGYMMNELDERYRNMSLNEMPGALSLFSSAVGIG